MVATTHSLDDLFVANDTEFIEKDNQVPNTITRTLVVVSDVSEVIYHLHEKLDIDIRESTVKIGFDYGGDCLKVCMLIVAKDHIGMINEAGTSAMMLKKMKLNSVKKVIILAAADVKEHHYNVKLLFNKVNLNSIKMQLSVDLKMANIVLGLQSHSSTHSCYICDSSNPFKPGVDWEKVDGKKEPQIQHNSVI